MRKLRENLPNRVYHLISRIARRAFYLNDGEGDRLSICCGGRHIVQGLLSVDAEGETGRWMKRTVSHQPYHKLLTLGGSIKRIDI